MSNEDLKAQSEELLRRSEHEPLAVLAHANCPIELWWELASKYPLEAQVSALYPLATLESPERWAHLEETRIDQWVEGMMERLPLQQRHLFAADCAERVLGFFSSEHPHDTRPHEAIRMIRLFTTAEITEEQRGDAITESANAAGGTTGQAQEAAMAASMIVDDPFDALSWANEAVASSSSEARSTAIGRERAWQWRRLQEYLRNT